LWLAPGLGVMAWAIAYSGHGLGLTVALAAAAGLLLMAAWPKSADPPVEHEGGMLPQGQRTLTWMTAAAGFGFWLLGSVHHLDSLLLDVWAGPLAVVPVVVFCLYTAVRPSPGRVQVAIGALSATVVLAGVDSFERGLFLLGHAEPLELMLGELMQIAAVIGSIGLMLGLRRRRPPAAAHTTWGLHDVAGLVVAAALGVAAMMGWTSLVAQLTLAPLAASSLLQAGWSVVLAAVSLTLVIAGLRLERALWRKLGILALFSVAAKVVAIDLAQVDLAWRVVSFLGLGLCLIAGAWAYGRFEKRMTQAA
jgi:hypothetical protein